MAARKAIRSGAAKTRSASSKAVSADKSPRKEVPIPYVYAADYKQLSSTGALVRIEKDSIVVTFYIDEMSPIRQIARLVSIEKEGASYRMAELEEEPRKLIIGSMRIDPEQAASLAALLAEKCYSIRPDLFPDATVKTPSDDKTK